MAVNNTLDPRKSFTSTRFKTSRFPGFMSQTLDTTGNVEEPQPAAVTSPLRGVGLGTNESDGPDPASTGKSYTDMTREEIDREYANRALNQDVFGLGMPTTAEEVGKKALGVLASATPVAAIGPLSRGLDYFTKDELDRAEQALSKKELEQTAKTLGYQRGSESDPNDLTGLATTDYDKAAIAGDPTARGFNTPQPDYSLADAGGDPNTGRGPTQGRSTDAPSGDESTSPGSGNDNGGSGPGDNGPSGPGDTDSSGEAAGGQEGGGAQGGEGGPGGWRQGGPIPNKGSPEIEPVRITAHETEHVMNPEATAYWGNDMLEAMSAIAEGVATPQQVQLVRQMINKGSAAAMPQSRPNPMQAMGSPLRSAGRGYLQ